MKEIFINFFKRLDLFGAPLFQYIDRNQSLYRSLIGGITTFLIFSSSIAYTIIILYQWQTNQLTPKIQHSTYVSDFALLDLNYDVIRFSFWNPSGDAIDPFSTNVLLPIVSYTTNYVFTNTVVLRLSNQTDQYGGRYILPQTALGFTTVSGEVLTTSEMYILFVKCEESLLPDGENCASEETIQQFYSQSLNTMIMEIYYKQVNSQDKRDQQSFEQFYFQLETTSCYTLNTFLQSTLFEIQDSLLFGSPKVSEYINGAVIQAQTNSINYCQMAYEYETYGVVYVTMKINSIKSIFEYPHAGDLLANIGSISSVLFLAKYIILFLNSNFLQEQIINELIQLYYPNFVNIKISKNWRGKISKVYYNSEGLNEQEQALFIDFFKKITRKMQLKLSIVNMLYEISRIYFLLRSTKSQDEIRKVHLIGIHFDFLKSHSIPGFESRQSSTSRDNLLRSQLLNYDDINLLSLDEKREQCFQEDKVPDELEGNLKDYYDLNRSVINH